MATEQKSSHPHAIISPSLLSCDFAILAVESERMTKDGADWLHVDVMDGHFVPNLTLGAPIVSSLRKHTKTYLDCHLMVSNPEQWVDDFATAGANGYTFHIEATKDAGALIDKIHAKGMKAGIAVKPKTSLDSVLPYASKADMILIMTVEPGFGGQSFMADMMPKVSALRAQFPTLNIQVDGGITTSNIDVCSKAGANVIVSGSGIFGHKNPAEAIKIMKDSINQRN